VPGATLTLTAPGVVFCGAFVAGTVFTAIAELELDAAVKVLVAGVCACGTVPAPGVPMPGKTVPCCKLPTLGCVGVGDGCVLAAVCVLDGVCFSGKLIGGSFGGTGMGAGVDVATDSAACGLRRNTPISGAVAAGTGPLRRFEAAVSVDCTRSVITFPSEFSV